MQDDLVLMVKGDGENDPQTQSAVLVTNRFDPDDEYHLNAGAVCLPGFWRLREKFGMSLDMLHFEARVPHYGAKLQKSMNRFFKTMTPDKPVTRNNVSSFTCQLWRILADVTSSSSNLMTVFTGHIAWAIRKAKRLPVS